MIFFLIFSFFWWRLRRRSGCARSVNLLSASPFLQQVAVLPRRRRRRERFAFWPGSKHRVRPPCWLQRERGIIPRRAYSSDLWPGPADQNPPRSVRPPKTCARGPARDKDNMAAVSTFSSQVELIMEVAVGSAVHELGREGARAEHGQVRISGEDYVRAKSAVTSGFALKTCYRRDKR